jgi:hypothetical protein
MEKKTEAKTGFTPGPWKVFTNTGGDKIIGIGELNGGGVADCGFGVWRGGDAEALANALLIASAPDLYEALQQAADALSTIRAASLKGCPDGYGKPELFADELYRSHSDVHSALKKIGAALARARGENP